MKIKSKLRLFLPVISIILLFYGYQQFLEGYGFKKEIVVIDSSDLKLMQEIQSISKISRLRNIDENIEIFTLLVKSIFGKIDLSSIDSVEVNTITDGGIDKIGEYRDLIVKAKADYLQQIYLLKEINENIRDFVVINKIEGSNAVVIINARVYGSAI